MKTERGIQRSKKTGYVLRSTCRHKRNEGRGPVEGQGPVKDVLGPSVNHVLVLKQRYPWFPLTIWLFFYFLKKAFQLSISSKDAEDQLLETSYLVLLIAVILAGLALTIFVLLELYATFSSQ